MSLYSDNKPLSIPVKTAYKPLAQQSPVERVDHSTVQALRPPSRRPNHFHDLRCGYEQRLARHRRNDAALFSKKGTLKSAQHRLFVWKGTKADGSSETATPSKVGEMKDEMGRLEKLIKRHERGDLPRVDWLDKLAYRQVEKVYQAESQSSDRLFSVR